MFCEYGSRVLPLSFQCEVIQTPGIVSKGIIFEFKGVTLADWLTAKDSYGDWSCRWKAIIVLIHHTYSGLSHTQIITMLSANNSQTQ